MACASQIKRRNATRIPSFKSLPTVFNHRDFQCPSFCSQVAFGLETFSIFFIIGLCVNRAYVCMMCVCVRDVGGEGMGMCAAACMWQSEENSVHLVLASHLNVVPGMDHLRSYLAQSIFVWGFGLVWFLRIESWT